MAGERTRSGVDDDSLVRIAARRAAKKIRAEAETPEFGRLLILQAASAAGDALLALALAGTLFFSVPAADAAWRMSTRPNSGVSASARIFLAARRVAMRKRDSSSPTGSVLGLAT